MIVAEELDMDMSQLDYRPPDTWVNGVGGGGGSGGISSSALALRAAAVAARARCSSWPRRSSASGRRASPSRSGVVSGGGKSVKYSDLIGGKQFKVDRDPGLRSSRPAVAGEAGRELQAGRHVPPRIDIPAKVRARTRTCTTSGSRACSTRASSARTARAA